MALSIPGVPVVFGSLQSVEASLFLTIGLGTSDPSGATAALEAIRKTAGYDALIQYASGKLSTLPVSKLVVDPQYIDLATTCITQLITSARKPEDIVPGQSVDFFSLKVADTNAAACQVTLSNSAWRVLEVNRLDYDGSDSLLQSSSFFLNGAMAVSFGNLYKGLIGNPTTIADPNKSDFTTIARSEYWIRGPGRFIGTSPPSGIPADSVEAWGKSMVTYILVPFLSVIFDSFQMPAPDHYWKTVGDIWGVIKDIVDLGVLYRAKSSGEMSAAAVNVLFDLLTSKAFLEWLVSIGISKVAVDDLGEFLLYIDLGFSAVNIAIVTYLWNTYSYLEFVPIRSNGVGVINIG